MSYCDERGSLSIRPILVDPSGCNDTGRGVSVPFHGGLDQSTRLLTGHTHTPGAVRGTLQSCYGEHNFIYPGHGTKSMMHSVYFFIVVVFLKDETFQVPFNKVLLKSRGSWNSPY